ncbi:MAG: hypothetical protein ACP5SD_07310, partial [Elusimicrobiales bacterium]
MAENKKIPPIPPLGFPSKPANKPAGSVPQIPSPITPRVSPPSFQKPQAQEDRGKEEREKLEKKIAELEKSLSEEREKVLALTIKNQQEEVLAAKLENSIRDVEEKIKRTQQEKALEEEKNQLKAKIKELETRLIQERETWMQTLKSQIKDKEKESKDIEEHFILRFQEFERKFLDEKAQWQKAIFSKDEEIKNIKLLLEQKTRIEEDYKRLLMEREGDKKEIERVLDSGFFDYEGFYIPVDRRGIGVCLDEIVYYLGRNDFLRLLGLKEYAKKQALKTVITSIERDLLMNAFIYLDILG